MNLAIIWLGSLFLFWGFQMQRIVCAANKLPDGTVILSVRHFDKWMAAIYDRIDPQEKLVPGEEIQGFVDNKGNFLTREQAYEVALKSGQCFKHPYKTELFSEDLY